MNATWRKRSDASRAAALAATLLLVPLGAHANSPYGFFPESEQVFRRLIADPRHIQLGAAYYRLDGRDIGDVALGHSWGMTRWYSNNDYWTWQWNIEAMAYSRFMIGGALNDFETVDFFADLPVAVRHDGFSTQIMLFHESSHLGDDYIRRTNERGFRYSIDGLRSTTSYEPLPWARIYGGGSYLLHAGPSPARWAPQWGFELGTKDLGISRKHPIRLFMGQDFQSHENAHWNVNARTVAGLTLGFQNVPRYLRIYGGYFDGHSPYGQFFQRRERYTDIGISLHF